MNELVLCFALLLTGAVAALMLARAPRVAMAVSMLAMAGAGGVLLVLSVPILLGGAQVLPIHTRWPLPLGHATLSVDGLAAWFLMVLGFLAACIAPYSVAYMRAFEGHAPVHRFGALMCALVAALVLFLCAADSVTMLLGWELMTLSAFFLVLFHDQRPEVRRGAWMYLIATHLAAALGLVPLLGLLYGAAGSTAFSGFAPALAGAGEPFLIVLFFLGLLGFGTKAGFFPMHLWLPAAHPVAPAPVSALLSAVVVKMGIYGLMRLLTWLPPMPAVCGISLLVLGVVSGVLGVLYALAQHDLKRLLAYHTIENIGIIAIAMALGMLGRTAGAPLLAVLGFGGALLHVANHALFKGLLFLSAGAVLHGTGTLEIERLGGLAKKTPANAFLFLVGAVAICGLPPLNGFVSEWVIYVGLVKGAQQSVGLSGGVPAIGVFSLALMGSLALACFAKVAGVVFLGSPRDASLETHRTPFAMIAGMSALAAACALIGLFPGRWAPFAHTAIGVLTETPAGAVGESFRQVLARGATLSTMGLVFLGIAGGLWLLRRFGGSGAGQPALAPTWGCGYARPTGRMQYTATSFALPLIRGFRGLLWPEFRQNAPSGPFPERSHVETHAPDMAEHDIFAPLFRGVARFSAMLRYVTWSGVHASRIRGPRASERIGPFQALLASTVRGLRQGTIQVYLSFIVITLILIFLVESFVAPFHSPPVRGPESGSMTETGIDE
jgi:hydrogenase-4 component B